MDAVMNVLGSIGAYMPIALAFVGAFSVLANFTPTETDNKVVAFVGKVVNFLAAYWNNPDLPTAKKPAAPVA